MRKLSLMFLFLALATVPAGAVCTITGSTIYLKDCGCPADAGGSGMDTQCWKDAITAASGTVNLFGSIQATQGKTYNIDDTLTIKEVIGGVIDGNGASIRWQGPNDINHPLFLFDDVQRLKMENLRVFATPTQPLYTAFEFTNGTGNNVAPNGDILDHIWVEGTTVTSGFAGVNFAVRFSKKFGVDTNNDLHVISNSIFSNIGVTAISIEHSQSAYHRFSNIDATGAYDPTTLERAPCSSFVSLGTPRLPNDTVCAGVFGGPSGSFTVMDFSGGGFTNADYDLSTSISANVLIVHHNSENSNRLLRQDGGSCCEQAVSFIGGRFAMSALSQYTDGHNDGFVIRFRGRGPLTMDRMTIDGGQAPAGVTPRFLFDPIVAPPIAPGEGKFSLTNMQLNWWTPDLSGNQDPIVELGAFARFTAEGNHCIVPGDPPGNFGVGPCLGSAGGSQPTVTASQLGTPVAGHSVFCRDCQPFTKPCQSGGGGAVAFAGATDWDCGAGFASTTTAQVLTNKNLSDPSNTFPSSLVTTTGVQTLTNKNLISTTNTFPQTGFISFSAKDPALMNVFCAPNAEHCSGSEPQVSLGVPRVVLKELRCKSTVAPGAGNSWNLRIRSNGANTPINCTISDPATTCPPDLTNTATLNSGAELALRVQRGGNPPTTNVTISCTVGAGP